MEGESERNRGFEEDESESVRSLRSSEEADGEANEFGAPRLCCVTTENADVFAVGLLIGWREDLLEGAALHVLLLLLERVELCDDLTDCGTPSHLELTFGTVGGSLVVGTVFIDPPLFAAFCFRCASANCSSAVWEGSFRVRKLRTPFFFFLVDDALESRDEDPLEDARLVDAEDCVLLESNPRVDLGVGGGVRVSGGMVNFACSNVPDEVLLRSREESPAAGNELRYVSFGILGGRANSEAGAMSSQAATAMIGRCRRLGRGVCSVQPAKRRYDDASCMSHSCTRDTAERFAVTLDSRSRDVRAWGNKSERSGSGSVSAGDGRRHVHQNHRTSKTGWLWTGEGAK